MSFNSLRTKRAETDSTATAKGPKPGDFSLGSAESRAAARAMVRGVGDGPQPGDIRINLKFLSLERAGEIYRLCLNTKEAPAETRGPSAWPRMWVDWPDGFDPRAFVESTAGLTIENAPEDLLWSLRDGVHKGLRVAKENGQQLPPNLDPDHVRNELGYVPKTQTKDQ